MWPRYVKLSCNTTVDRTMIATDRQNDIGTRTIPTTMSDPDMRRTGTRKMITDAQMITEAKRVTTGKTSACTRTGSIMHMVFDTTIGHWQIIGVDRRNPKHYDGNRQPQNPRPRDENPVNSWREPPNKYRRDDQCKLPNGWSRKAPEYATVPILVPTPTPRRKQEATSPRNTSSGQARWVEFTLFHLSATRTLRYAMSAQG